MVIVHSVTKMHRNEGCELDLTLLKNVRINQNCVNNLAETLVNSRQLKDTYRASWLLKAITCIDLTTLAGDDTPGNVARLCFKAANPLNSALLEALGFTYGPDCLITTAAVCVYPARVADAVSTLQKTDKLGKINVASVATGFPSGQTPLKTRLDEIRFAVQMGATEVDIVIDRSLVLRGKWEELYKELKEMKLACGERVHMKAILAVGELGSLKNVYKASLAAMMAGADFIKTSTGKETVNATIPFGIVMCRAIKHYYTITGFKVGLKPAGGIKTSGDAISWLILIKEILGNDWLNKDLFRFGASGLLSDIEQELFRHVHGFYPSQYDLV